MPSPNLAGFRKASIRGAKLKAIYYGPSNSGKSYAALVTAKRINEKAKKHKMVRGNGETMVIDAEKGRVEEQYADVFDFYTHILASYEPEAYIDAFDKAVSAEFSTIIIDQISYEWDGPGGILEQNNKTQKDSGKTSFQSWADTKPRHNKFMQKIMSSPYNLICTCRTKNDWVMDTNDKGKIVPVKVGLAPIQSNDVEYEFDVKGNIDSKHIITIESRGSLSRLIGDRQFRPGKNVDDAGDYNLLGDLIGDWMCGRADQTGYITTNQIQELQDLGSELRVPRGGWESIFKSLGVNSIDLMTTEMYEKIKKDMSSRISSKGKETNI